MKRAKQLGSVVFEYNTLFIQEEFVNDSILADTQMSAAGTHIVYGSTIVTPYITLDSKEYGWIDETQKDVLVAMWEDFSTTQTLTYDDNTTDTVRMAVEKQLEFTPLFEGSCKYTAVIPLAKI